MINTQLNMSKIQQLRALVAQRLTLAAEDIFGVVERTIAEYEEEASRSKLELQRQQNLLDAVLKPEIKLYKADHRPPDISEGKISVKQEELSLNLDYDNLELPQMTDQSRDDVTEFIFTPLSVKTEHDHKQTLPVCYASAQNAGPVEEPIPDRTTQQSGDSGEAPGASSGFQSLPTDWKSGGGDDPGNGGGHNDLADDYWGEIESSHSSALKALEDMRRLLMAPKERKRKKSDFKSPSQSKGGPYQCGVCGKIFTYITPFKNHVQKHTEDTDFSGICDEHFLPEESRLCRADADFSDVSEEEDDSKHGKKRPVTMVPYVSVRSPANAHLPERIRMNYAKRCGAAGCTGRTRVRCATCKVFLCLQNERNCYRAFHT